MAWTPHKYWVFDHLVRCCRGTRKVPVSQKLVLSYWSDLQRSAPFCRPFFEPLSFSLCHRKQAEMTKWGIGRQIAAVISSQKVVKTGWFYYRRHFVPLRDLQRLDVYHNSRILSIKKEAHHPKVMSPANWNWPSFLERGIRAISVAVANLYPSQIQICISHRNYNSIFEWSYCIYPTIHS